MTKPVPKYTNMTHQLTTPEKYPDVKIRTIMHLDTLYIIELIDQGIFKPSPRARQELQYWIDRILADQSIVADPLDYTETYD